MPEAKRQRGTGDKIIAAVCNEHRNSDLRADNPAILCALNERFAELERQTNDLRKEALEALANMATARNQATYWNSRAIAAEQRASEFEAIARAAAEQARATAERIFAEMDALLRRGAATQTEVLSECDAGWTCPVHGGSDAR